MKMRNERGRAQTDDGDMLAWKTEGCGPSMLIMNGLVSSVDPHWTGWVDYYRNRFSVVTWDYRGHGASSGPQNLANLTIEGFADDGATVLLDSGLSQPSIVCGLSMGVQSALEFYRRHPENVSAIVLICGTAGHPLDRLHPSPVLRDALTRFVGVLESAPPRLIEAIMYPFAKTRLGAELAFLTGGATRGKIAPEALTEIFAHATSRHPSVFARITGSYLNHNAWDMLESIDVPTLIIAGDKDDLTPVSTSEAMHRLIPGSDLHIVHGHGHLAQVENPAEVHRVVDAFLAKHGLA